MPPSWHPAPACAPRLRCRRAILSCSSDCAASIPKFGPEIKNRCSLWAVLEGFLASIPKFGLEIKNRCTQKVVFGEILASIRKFGPEVKNRCTEESLNREKLASIPKSELEIKNRCTLALRRRSAGETILLCGSEEWNRTRTSLPLRPLQAELFSFAAAKNGIGCGPHCRYGRCRRNHSYSRQQRMESDADIVAASDSHQCSVALIHVSGAGQPR